MKRWLLRRVIDRIGIANIIALLFLSAVPALVIDLIMRDWHAAAFVGGLFVVGIAMLFG